MSIPRNITRAEFDIACDALWSEIVYQNNLPRRTPNEAKDPQGFATLGRRYLRALEDHWADQGAEANARVGYGEPEYVVPACLDDLRKLGAIFVRAMVYCGIRQRPTTRAVILDEWTRKTGRTGGASEGAGTR